MMPPYLPFLADPITALSHLAHLARVHLISMSHPQKLKDGGLGSYPVQEVEWERTLRVLLLGPRC
jgi:hypothetical protein